MKKTFKILKLSRKKVTTKFGEKEKFDVNGQSEKGTFWADAWVNKDTQDWSEGQTVTGYIESRQYNGKTYYTVRPVSLEEKILEKLERIETLLSGKQNNLEDSPVPNEEEPSEEIPF